MNVRLISLSTRSSLMPIRTIKNVETVDRTVILLCKVQAAVRGFLTRKRVVTDVRDAYELLARKLDRDSSLGLDIEWRSDSSLSLPRSMSQINIRDRGEDIDGQQLLETLRRMRTGTSLSSSCPSRAESRLSRSSTRPQTHRTESQGKR